MAYLSHLKFIFVFVVTCLLGIVSVSTDGAQVQKRNVFTWEQALSHLNKKVRNTCNAKGIRSEDTTGRTAFVDKDDFNGGYYVVIDWDYSPRGRHEIFHTSKETYENCIIEVSDIER
ncbi:MAG: hypothetical protein ACT4O9_03755 [Blastocatellia bacterium]